MDLPMGTKNVRIVCGYLSIPDDSKFLGLLVESTDLVDLCCSAEPVNIDPIP